MEKLYDRYDVEPINGKDVTTGDRLPEIFISESDQIFCYLGICLSDSERRNRASFMQPHYMKEKHSTDEAISKEIKGFYRIINGCITLDNYIDKGVYSNYLYKKN